MRKLDFISKSPNFYIFKESANKTNLGGVLFLVYIIIIVLLASVYFYDYFKNEKYTFSYSLVQETHNRSRMIDKGQIQSKLNTELNFMVFLGKDYVDKYPDISNNTNFIIVDITKLDTDKKEGEYNILNSTENSNDDERIIKQHIPFKDNVKNLTLGVFYRCKGDNCTIRPEDKIKIKSYYLYFAYQGFSIEHQNPNKPIQPLGKDNYWLETVQFLENTNIVYLNWEMIEYQEERGIFKKTFDDTVGINNTYYGGYYKSKDTFTDDGHLKVFPQTYWKVKDLNGNNFIMLLYLESIVQLKEYERYSRKAASVLGILANIASLSSTALNLMGLAYGFLYRANYDNYKIIENILTKKMKININKKSPEKEESEKVKIELKGDLIEKELIENDINEPDDDIVEEHDEKIKSSYLNLSIPNFFYFLFHFFYSKCCGRSSNHILINSCNDIVAKYITIENILYNQMKLECLWQDYKWNNPQYKIKHREDLILDLKEK